MKFDFRSMPRYCVVIFLISVQLHLTSCNMVYKSTGDIMIGFAEDQGVPYLLTTNDVALGCSMSEAFTPFILGFSQVTTPPDQLAILFYLMAGNCSEFKAWEEELRYLRAVHAKNTTEAQDARIVQQRLLNQAARRQLLGYRFLVTAMVEPGTNCPDFSSDEQELYWLIGLTNGIQAIINDIASGGNAEVPLNIAAKAGRGATCLNNQKWWGVPDALQAAISLTIPGNQTAGKDPFQLLEQSMQIGLQQGIRLTQMLAAQVYLGKGNITRVKQIIREHALAKAQNPANQKYIFLDEITTLQLQATSDRLWTEATGKRTPTGKLGTFWDDQNEALETIDIDDLL